MMSEYLHPQCNGKHLSELEKLLDLEGFRSISFRSTLMIMSRRTHLYQYSLCRVAQWFTARHRRFSVQSKLPIQEPQLLTRLRADLKDAMRARDTLRYSADSILSISQWSDAHRLNVIRGSLAAIGNASKTPNPATTDESIAAILHKQAKESRSAAQDFEAEKRSDLSEQEMLRVTIVENYLHSVERFGDEEISKAVGDIVAKLRAERQVVKLGQVMKVVKASLQGKVLDMEKVSGIVRGMIN